MRERKQQFKATNRKAAQTWQASSRALLFNLLKLDISETFNRAVKKRIASRYLKLGDADLSRVTREIDGEPPEAERMA